MSLTGSTGGLHDIKTTAEVIRKDLVFMAWIEVYRKSYPSDSSLREKVSNFECCP